MKNALRQFSQETGQAQPRRVPSNTSTSATIIPLSAVSGGGSGVIAGGKPSAAPNQPPRRRASRGGDLIFGGTLALILLIACLTWEVMSRGNEASHAAFQGDQRAFIPAAH